MVAGCVRVRQLSVPAEVNPLSEMDFFHQNDRGLLRLPSVDSTNAEALRRAAAGERGPLWILADVQTAGRGRAGRSWVSEPGNLHASLLVTLAAPAPKAYQLSLVTGVAVYDAIRNAMQPAPAALRLKWPNDLILASSKAGGILVESVRGHLLIGVGVNVCNEPPAGFSALGYIGLQKVEFSVLEGIEAGIGLACDREASLPARYARLDCLAKREVRVTRGDETLDGTASGVDASGRLLLVQAGRTIAIETGSVRLRRSDH